MSPTEWRNKKKEWRANGEGIKIVEYMTRAYNKFLNK
jgi:hypothetical protein